MLIQSGPCPTGHGSHKLPVGQVFLIETSQGAKAKIEVTDYSPGITRVIGGSYPDNYHAVDGIRFRWVLANEQGLFCNSK